MVATRRKGRGRGPVRLRLDAPHRFGYALGNGTVGIYDRASRAWRFKSKHAVVCIGGHARAHPLLSSPLLSIPQHYNLGQGPVYV